METPRTFTDRIYLTDIVDIIWKVISEAETGAEIQLLWRKRYFPWRMKLTLYGGSILLSSKLFGESSWTSTVEMQFSDFNGSYAVRIDDIIQKFVIALGRPPYESPYWDDITWQKFSDSTNISRQQVQTYWSRYLEALEEMDNDEGETVK